MGYRYSCADCAFPLMEHDNVIKLIKLLEFDGVDITLFQDRSHLQPSEVFQNTRQRGEALRGLVEEQGLGIADVFLQCDLDFAAKAVNHPQQDIRDHTWDWFLQTVEFAKVCHTTHVTILPGVHFPQETYEQSFERSVRELDKRLDFAEEHGLVLSVEPHIGSLIETPVKAQNLLDALPRLTFTLDYTHFAKVGIPDGEVEPLLKRSTHFHARGAALGRVQCNMDENTIDYVRLVHAMKEYEYQGYIGVEYIHTKWEDCDKSDNISESIVLKNLMKESER